ncbi:MAG: hypothetical protein ABI867_17290, partial [Kofleriaceae bacterium]
SARSDVYAFAVALVEALGGDPESLAPPARRAITAALAEASADRPRDASVLVAALTARRSRAAHVAVAAGVATVLAAGGLVFALRGSDAAPPDCDPDPSRFAGSWDPAYKAKLAAALDPAAPDLRAELDRAYAVGDAIVVDDTAMRVASCRAHAAGTLTAPQLAMRMACLDRRIYELGARVEFVAAKPKRAASLASAALTNLPGLDRCAVVEGSPLATAEARADAKALYRRFFIGGDMVAPDAAAALAPVIVDAAKTGDLELASRAATRRAEKLSATSGPDVDPVLVEAHRYAVLAKSDAAAAQALVERSKHALGRFDFGGARALAEQALELVDRAYVPAITRAAIFHAVGRAAARRGDPITGLTFLRRGLAAIDPRTERAHSTRIDLQLDQLRALEAIEGTAAERLRIAVDTIELARIRYRGTGADYRSALELAGSAAKALGDHAKAQQYERAALEAVLAQKTYTPATEVRRRAMLAIELVRAGKFADAYAQYSEAAKQAGELPEIARDRPVYLAAAGATLAAMGRLEEANVILEETIVDFAERYGKDHDKTAQVIRLVTAFELELGRFDSAARRIDQLERALRAKSEPTDEARARLTGELAARLVLLRGNATAADELARRTLSSFEELGATREAKSGTQRVRLEALGELHRYGEARDLAIAELELARTKADDPAAIAMLEVELARAEYGLGNRAAALQRARNVAPVLDKWRISPIARKKLAELRARPE